MNIIESIIVTDDVTLISLQDCPNDITFLAQLFEIISNSDINVDMISQTPAKGGLIDISFTVSSEQLAEVLSSMSTIRCIHKSVKIDILSGNCKISIFGEAMRSNPGVATKVFNVAKEQNINITLITTSEVDISLLIENANCENFVMALKKAFA
ncbi:MAG: ACT domain-containing protein [Clostridia bacterium]|nr:ACT domain-containing protein [Clostridia bacterium]